MKNIALLILATGCILLSACGDKDSEDTADTAAVDTSDTVAETSQSKNE